MKNAITLYHYLHCPFCIRVRLACGFLDISYDSVLLPYSDEETPTRLTGKKMAPIIEKYDGTFMNESLDIIRYLDVDQKLSATLKSTESLAELDIVNHWINDLSKPLFNYLMPYYVHGVEFSEKDKEYFRKKKEVKRGPFKELVKNRAYYITEIEKHLSSLYPNLSPFYKNNHMGLLDILLVSHLWGLYFAYDYRMNDQLHNYLQLVAEKCHFNYDWDWWKNH